METNYLIWGVLAFVLMLFITPLVRNLAFKINLTDKPNKRKVHQKPVPLVGGISIALVASITIGAAYFFGNSFSGYGYMLLGALSLCVLGTFDDKWDIRASVKFAFQILLAHFAFQNGFHIDSFYGIFGVSQIPTFVQYFLSIIIIVGVVNAFNLMDGIDGLAGGIGVVSLVILIYLCVVVDAKILMLLYIILLSALLGFLRFNLSKSKKIFMGDAGSLAIGFIIILSGLDLLKKAAPIQETSTVLVGIFAVLTLPVFDALRVFKQRIQSGKSPFSADKTHLHHMMLQLGFNHKSSTVLIVGLSALLVFIGFVTSSFYSITIGIVFILILFYSVSRYLYLKSQLLGWRDRIRKMESDYGL